MADLTKQIHPNRITCIEEVDACLSDLEKLAKQQGIPIQDCGFALLQNLQLGGFIEPISREKYEAKLPGQGRREFYCKYWAYSYFVELRAKLSRAE